MSLRRTFLALTLATLMAGCAVAPPAVTQPQAMREVTVVVRAAGTDAPVPDAAVTLDSRPAPYLGSTGADGRVSFAVPVGFGPATHLWVTASGFVDYSASATVAPGPVSLVVTLTAAEPPPPSFTPTREQMTRVMANFCNLHDSTGRPIFSSSLAAQAPEMQDEWISREKAAGGTHYVLSIKTGYTSYPPIVDFFLDGRMAEWLTTLDRVLAARLTPVVFLHSGDGYPGLDYFRNVLSQIPASYYPRVVWVAGWETVRGGWTSRQFRDSHDALRALLGPDAILAAHLSPGRLSFASNPVEADDPWGGDEVACYRTGWGSDRRGQHPFDVLLYQTDPYRPGDVFTTDEGKGERAEEVATRVLGTHVKGAPDWFAGLAKRPTLIAFETVAYHYIRGNGDDAFARVVATFFQRLGYRGFGNGLPQ